jgi:hypothetical protein
MLTSASSIYKSQTFPLVIEDAHKNRAVIVKDKQISGRKHQMGAVFQDKLADCLSVVT